MHKENAEHARETLHKLRTELTSSAEGLNEETQTLITALADDIDLLLGDEPTESQPGKHQLEEIAIKFETDHPRLAGILSELADTLSKLGI
jgi:hypothetical protein